jgi:tripartite-type tricarboxylate transporter receptor subunit TctC
MPALPTIAESGFPGFETDSWFGFLAPARTSVTLVRKVNADTARVLSSPELVSALAQQGAQPGGGSPEDFRRYMQSEIVKWREAIVKAKVPLAN